MAGRPRDVVLTADEVGGGIALSKLLVMTRLAPAEKEAKRSIASGAVRVNGVPHPSADLPVERDEIGDGYEISIGKKKRAVVRLG